MGDCQCSNITIMQLFHELKQQFPALPDHVVSQCIAQNSHDRETCARSLRATQDSRPSPGAFPPPPPQNTIVTKNCGLNLGNNVKSKLIQNHHHHHHHHSKAHRPVSLEIGPSLRQCSTTTRCRVLPPLPTIIPSSTTTRPAPSSAPATYSTRGFFDELPTTNITSSSPIDNYSGIRNLNSSTAGFEVNVNVACSPAGNHDFRTVQSPGLKRNNSQIVESRSHFTNEQRAPLANEPILHQDHARSYTSVSLTLRPPCSEPQPPIDIRSQGSSLTYSTSSLNLRGFQSCLQISIGPGSVGGSVTAARIRPPMAHSRPNSLISTVQSGNQRPPGLPAGPPSQLPRPTTIMSAPTTPLTVSTTGIITSSSLPTTPLAAQQMSTVTTSLPSSPIKDSIQIITDSNRSPLNQVAEHQRQLVAEQLIRKERLAKKLAAEKGRLEAMKKELQALLRPMDPRISPEDLERKLRSEIYQLQVECDILTKEVDKRSDPNVPLGETNEEFYQGIYTGQSLNLPGYRNPSPPPPPLPSTLPAWETNQHSSRLANSSENDDDKDGPSWVCRMCTFDNHPLMDQCEQCGMPRFPSLETGTKPPVKSRVPAQQM
ncbi:hypothetical protein PV328_004519 [Microctonus aethiopoides]|uniref:RanBP2-type domain-containing protein n=1 Tax=Microctonus aethiopoides TaxID=144406 RepID=A0AA39FAZ3_9HYME|nr:hypothetical protein PV328_004519 [Microctonus aethiopoides]